ILGASPGRLVFPEREVALDEPAREEGSAHEAREEHDVLAEEPPPRLTRGPHRASSRAAIAGPLYRSRLRSALGPPGVRGTRQDERGSGVVDSGGVREPTHATEAHMTRSVLAGKAQTVLGPVAAEELGITLPHEHLLIDFRFMFREPEGASGRGRGREPVGLANLYEIRYDWTRNLDNLQLLDERTATEE